MSHEALTSVIRNLTRVSPQNILLEAVVLQLTNLGFTPDLFDPEDGYMGYEKTDCTVYLNDEHVLVVFHGLDDEVKTYAGYVDAYLALTGNMDRDTDPVLMLLYAEGQKPFRRTPVL